MAIHSALEPYQKYYVDLQFERAGLFKTLQERYGSIQVLYPGSSIHITPSFFFPHVVYVDQHSLAKTFFADPAPVLTYLNRHKAYRRSTYLRFIAQDFTQPLPLRAGEFDLLLSLFAGGIVAACKQYLRPGGLLVTNNLEQEAKAAVADAEFKLEAVVRFQGSHYACGQENLTFSPKSPRAKRYLRSSNHGVTYIETEAYYIFRRVSANLGTLPCQA